MSNLNTTIVRCIDFLSVEAQFLLLMMRPAFQNLVTCTLIHLPVLEISINVVHLSRVHHSRLARQTRLRGSAVYSVASGFIPFCYVCSTGPRVTVLFNLEKRHALHVNEMCKTKYLLLFFM